MQMTENSRRSTKGGGTFILVQSLDGDVFGGEGFAVQYDRPTCCETGVVGP